MDAALAQSEPLLRLGVFATGLVVLLAFETLAPRRPRSLSRLLRWPGNLGIALLDTLLIRVVLPASAVGVAVVLDERGIGLFATLELPAAVAGVLSFLALDLAVWAQHVALHRVPLLWRLHRMHHIDRDLDVTTGLRFHPFEIALSMAFKLTVIAALGAPPAAVLVFEIVLNTGALFTHANISLPGPLDRALRTLIVTPDMHRVHHSVLHEETDSNFGFNLSIWDRLFKTYRAQPARGHLGMELGLPGWEAPDEQRIDRLLVNPFARERR